MPRKYRQHATRKGKVYITPLNRYFYEDEKVYFIADDLFDPKMFIKPAAKSFSYTSDDFNLVANWIEQAELAREDLQAWLKIIGRITGFFEIDLDDRIRVYQDYRETTLAKLKRWLKVVEKALYVLDNEPAIAHEEILHLGKKWMSYKKFYESLRQQRSGPRKLLILLIKPVFEKLNEYGLKPLDQRQIVMKLFMLGNWDEFNDRYSDKLGFFDEEGALKFIEQLQRESNKLRLKPPNQP